MNRNFYENAIKNKFLWFYELSWDLVDANNEQKSEPKSKQRKRKCERDMT